MTPLRGFVERLKPHFKTTPRGGSPAQASTAAGQPAAGAQPGTGMAPAATAAAQAQAPAAQAQIAPAQAPPAPAADDRPPRDELLARRFAELQWDLGGLTYEMAIRDHFRLDLLVAQAARLQAVDAELAADERARSLQRSGAAGNCPTCGALYARGAAFCSHCGTHLLAGARPGQPAAQPQIAASPQPAAPAQPPVSPAAPTAQPPVSPASPTATPPPASPPGEASPPGQPATPRQPSPPAQGSGPA